MNQAKNNQLVAKSLGTEKFNISMDLLLRLCNLVICDNIVETPIRFGELQL
jgi:hypothetical protein